MRAGQRVEAGDELTEGSVDPHDILRSQGRAGVQQYLVREVQKVYRSQGVDINDKHIEIIVRQMMRKVKVEDPGDTELLPGGLYDKHEFEEENRRVEAAGRRPAVAKPMLLGITKASLATECFLSAASFQETTRVLTDAAIKGKVDPLVGLKENVHHRQADPCRNGHGPVPEAEGDPAGGCGACGGKPAGSQGVQGGRSQCHGAPAGGHHGGHHLPGRRGGRPGAGAGLTGSGGRSWGTTWAQGHHRWAQVHPTEEDGDRQGGAPVDSR